MTALSRAKTKPLLLNRITIIHLVIPFYLLPISFIFDNQKWKFFNEILPEKKEKIKKKIQRNLKYELTFVETL